MDGKRFELLDETIFDNQKQAEDGGRVTYWVVEYQQRQELVELLNSLNEEKEKAEKDDVEKLVDCLNEQQATINNQEQKIKILQQEINDTQAILEMLTEKLKGWK